MGKVPITKHTRFLGINTYRDALKALRELKNKKPVRIYIRIGARGPVFEVERKGESNVYLTPIDPHEEKVENQISAYKDSQRKLRKKGQPGEGYVKQHSTTYGNLGRGLAKYKPQKIAQAIHEKFANKTPYPNSFTQEAKETMDELFALLFMVRSVSNRVCRATCYCICTSSAPRGKCRKRPVQRSGTERGVACRNFTREPGAQDKRASSRTGCRNGPR